MDDDRPCEEWAEDEDWDTLWIPSQAVAQLVLTERCPVIRRNIYINSTEAVINLPHVQIITGGLIVTSSPSLIEVSMPQLHQINGSLELENLEGLQQVDFGKLQTIGGSITLVGLPKLNRQPFSQTINASPELSLLPHDFLDNRTLTVESTNISTLDDGNSNVPWIKNIRDIRIVSNPSLMNISFHGLRNSAANMSISRNHPDLRINFDALETAASISITNAAEVKMPKLVSMEGDLNIFNCSMRMLSLMAMNKTEAGIYIRQNSNLQKIELNSLKVVGVSYYSMRSVGNLAIEDNPSLTILDGFNSLASVRDAVTLTGNFTR